MPQILDGKATAAAIKNELTERVEALKARGITPGLGTVLVGDDPASHSYVGAKHRDCAEIGINSIRVDLPADITQEQLEAEIDKLNHDPACTSYIVQLPLPKHLDTNRIWRRSPRERRRRAAPHQPRQAGAERLRAAGLAPAVHPQRRD